MNSPFRESLDSNHAVALRPGKLWSLWDMLKFNATDFYNAVTSLHSAFAVVRSHTRYGSVSFRSDELMTDDANNETLKHVQTLQKSLVILGTRLTEKSAARLIKEVTERSLTYGGFSRGMEDIDQRLQDELSDTKAFVLEGKRSDYFEPKEPLFGSDFEKKFLSAGVFELDEAAKCRAFGHDTAAVFHLMRLMEIGIRVTATCLGIPDPTKPNDRNWHEILKKIKGETDARFANKTWKPSGDKEFFDSAYVSLDAVRIAWRNPTMHIENKYTPDEADDVFVAVRLFIKKLASRMDEQGQPLA
jgi:hypothetical protein